MDQGSKVNKKYAFRKELKSITAGTQLWILADCSDVNENKLRIRRLLAECPDALPNLVVHDSHREALEELYGKQTRCVLYFLSPTNGFLPVEEMATLISEHSTVPLLIAGTMPYDSYGEDVKHYEGQLIDLLKRYAGHYLILDLHHDIARIADASAVKERVKIRKWRIATYKYTVLLLLKLSKILLREKNGWIELR